MIQKKSCSLSTKVNTPFYDMVKIGVTIISIVTIFTIYETLSENVITTLLITYQNKTKMPGKIRIRQVIPTIYKLFQYNFWCNCSEFSDKIDVTITLLEIWK